MRKLNKKAGMELSINAIVILIIAMIVLALGVLFVRGLFVKAGEKLGGAVSGAQVSKPASPDEPMTLDPSALEFSVSAGDKSKTEVVSVYNMGSPSQPVGIYLTSCSGTVNVEAGTDVRLLAPTQIIAANKAGNWNAAVLVNTTKLTKGNSAVCTVKANQSATVLASTTLTIDVTD